MKRQRHKLMTRSFFHVEQKDQRQRFKENKTYNADGHPETPQYSPLPPNQWKESILDFAQYNVVKCGRVFQTIFYLLGYTREEICERDTNKLEWKKAKKVLLGENNDGAEFFKRLTEYNPFGAKDVQLKAY
jgi:hypothetical protein